MFAFSSSKSRAGRTRLSPPRVSPRLAASVSYVTKSKSKSKGVYIYSGNSTILVLDNRRWGAGSTSTSFPPVPRSSLDVAISGKEISARLWLMHVSVLSRHESATMKPTMNHEPCPSLPPPPPPRAAAIDQGGRYGCPPRSYMYWDLSFQLCPY